MTDTELVRMMASQCALQRAMGYDVEAMTQEERVRYIHENVTNVVSEVMEALAEVNWKSWSQGSEIRQDACFGELRDAWQCLTNAMWAVYSDRPYELARRLADAVEAKHVVNYRRLIEGYDGHSNKCPACRRALDDTAVRCTVTRCELAPAEA